MPDTRARFLKYTVPEPNSGCLLWAGAANRTGYGVFAFEGRMRLAHRVALVLDGRRTPDDLHVCHRCDTPLCVNPDHLFVGTQYDNMADRRAKGRARNQNTAKTHCKNGHAFTPENTYDSTRANGTTKRSCRACQRLNDNRYNAKRHNTNG